jgi:hypothetical protein
MTAALSARVMLSSGRMSPPLPTMRPLPTLNAAAVLAHAAT